MPKDQRPTKPPSEPSSGGRTQHEGDQVPRPAARRRAVDAGGGYVRLRMRVEDGEMSIVDVHHVDSELVMPERLLGSNAYDVTLGERLLHADSVPDVGVSRSFPNPDPNAPPEQHGHHFHELSMYEFDVRVPVSDLSPEDLPEVAVSYFKLKETPEAPVRREPLHSQFARETREVMRVTGLPPEVLEK